MYESYYLGSTVVFGIFSLIKIYITEVKYSHNLTYYFFFSSIIELETLLHDLRGTPTQIKFIFRTQLPKNYAKWILKYRN